LILLLGASLAGCLQPAFRPAGDFSGTVRLDVPFVSQNQGNDCGPAALTSVLAFHGQNLTLDEVTGKVFTPGLERTLLPDMENYARSLGLATRSGRGDADLIRQSVSGGNPVILMLEVGGRFYSQGHYVVVYGHDPQGFLMHVGTGAGRYLSEQELLERWEPMNRLYLVVE
jgi:ABC-type bacteriocin/lantibiotic exporter with double-glycine peptidase domain